MTTWGNLLAYIRAELQDTGASPRWADSLLHLYACDGIRDYSRWIPKRVDRLQIDVSGEKFALPDGYLEDISVECPLDAFLARREGLPGKTYNEQSGPRQYWVVNGDICLDGPAGAIFLSYYALHGVPANAEDAAFALTVPDENLDLIRMFVIAKVHIQMRGKTARLDRFEPGSGRRDDNPLLPETTDLMADYHSKLIERASVPTVIRLYRPAR